MNPENLNIVGKNSLTQACVKLNDNPADSCAFLHCIDNGTVKILDGIINIGA
jgi:hypothetical protein